MNTKRIIHFGVDFDETVTEDKIFFSQLIKLINDHGHRATIVTFRFDNGDNRDVEEFAQITGCNVVYCEGKQKKMVAPYINVWIDDMPQLIPHYQELVGIARGCLMNELRGQVIEVDPILFNQPHSEGC